MKLFRLVLRNLVRNRRRSVLTTLSIALSLFVFTTLTNIPRIADRVLEVSSSSPRIVCHSKSGFTVPLPESHRAAISRIPHVVAISAWSYYGGIYRDPSEQFGNFAVDADTIDQAFPDWGISGRPLEQFRRLRTACFVSPDVMRRFGWSIGQQVKLRSTLPLYPRDLSLTIVGELSHNALPTFLFFRRDYLEEAEGRRGSVQYFWIRVDRPQSIAKVISEVDRTFANSDAETETESEKDLNQLFVSAYMPLIRLIKFLGVVALVTITFVAANTAAMSVRERRREIAVLRSIGFGSPAIVGCLVGESILLALVGGTAGALAGAITIRMLPGLLGVPTILISPSVFAESLILAIAIGVLSGLIPAVASARRGIVDEMRVVA